MKVFLSHSTKDKEFVQRLAAALDGADFTPWLCEVDIDRGENFVARINEGLAQSDPALLVWSPDAAKSAWTEQEWTSLLAQQVEEHKIRLGIILLREHPLPPLLRTSNRIEARWDQAAAIRETLDWLKGRQRVQRLSGLKAPVYLPDYRPKDFVGREAYLGRLQEVLTIEPGTFLLHGEPGTGNSMLALRFAWDTQYYLDTAFGEDEVTRHREALLGFAHKVEMLPIAVAVGASLLREKSASRLDRSVLKLRLDNLNDGVRDVPQLFRKAIASQPPREQRLLAGAAVCVQEGFWLPLVAQIAKLSEDEADDAADRLVNSSLLRVLDREQRRFQLHALLRERVRAGWSTEEQENLQEAHAAALEDLFGDWETH